MARYIIVLLVISIYCCLINASSFYDNPEQDPIALADYPPGSAEDLHRKWDSDWSFSGISTFAHLKHVRCLSDRETSFDIGIIGAPFDTAVSYRPGMTTLFHRFVAIFRNSFSSGNMSGINSMLKDAGLLKTVRIYRRVCALLDSGAASNMAQAPIGICRS